MLRPPINELVEVVVEITGNVIRRLNCVQTPRVRAKCEIQLTGGSLLQLDRDQPTSLVFGISPLPPFSISPAACASRHAAAAASSPMGSSRQGGGRHERLAGL